MSLYLNIQYIKWRKLQIYTEIMSRYERYNMISIYITVQETENMN